MITWNHPALLWLLALLPLVAALFLLALRRREEALQQFAEARLLPTLTPDRAPRRAALRVLLRFAALTLALVALAGPRWGFRWEEVRREGVDIVIALDTSRSMLAEDVKPNRLRRAQLAVEELLRQLRGDRVALVPFAGSAFALCPLTLDYDAFRESLQAVEVGIIPRGGTSLAAAIETSLEAFEGREGRHSAVILITDGEDHDGKVQEAAKVAAERGVRIYPVGIGSAEGDLIPVATPGQTGFVKDRKGQVVKTRLEESSLQAIADTTSGVYVRGAGPTLGLDRLHEEHLSRLDRRELQSTREKKFEQRFQIPLLLAFGFLFLEPLIGNRRRRPRRREAA